MSSAAATGSGAEAGTLQHQHGVQGCRRVGGEPRRVAVRNGPEASISPSNCLPRASTRNSSKAAAEQKARAAVPQF